MKEKGWRPFWAALLAALLVLLPLVGGTVLLTRRSLRTRLASRPQSGVAIRQPKEENRLSLLVCIAPTETTAPGFLLLYLSASQNCIHTLALPGELTVPFGADEASLADCYRAAGPARCREALLSALSLPEDTHYLALAPSVLQAIADRYGMLRVGFSGALTAEELAVTGCSSNVQAVSAREAEELLNGMEDTVLPAHKAAARAAVWDAFFRQELELLPATLPDALRAHSSSLLTDLTAQDLLILEDTLEFLADRSAAIHTEALPGEWDGECYTLTDAPAPPCRPSSRLAHRGTAFVGQRAVTQHQRPAQSGPAAGEVIVTQEAEPDALGLGGGPESIVRRGSRSSASKCRPVCRPVRCSSSGAKASRRAFVRASRRAL